MLRWCPRCEWVGRGPPGPCPRCGAPLLDAEDDGAPRASTGGDAAPAPRPSACGRRCRAAISLGVALALALLWLGLLRLPTRGTGPVRAAAGPGRSRERSAPGLPARLGFISGGFGGGPGAELFFAAGDGAGPRASAAGRRIRSFAWSPGGTHVVAVDLTGRALLLPGRRVLPVPSPAREVAFSPDGRLVAVCSGRPGRMTVVAVARPARALLGPLPGCAPRWSPDSAWVAFRAGTGGRGDVLVLDVSSGRVRTTRLRWPAAWAPAWIGPSTLTGTTPRGVARLDPSRAGPPRLLRWPSQVRGSPRRVRALAWSPDGRWLAVALATRRGAAVAVLGDSAGAGASVRVRRIPGSAFGRPPALVWSSRDRLLVSPVGANASGTEVITPGGGVLDLGLEQASWSPDGRWILGRSMRGWVAVDAAHPSMRSLLAVPGAQWVAAAWCCPAPATPAG